MRLKNDTENFAASFNITPPYQMRVIHSSKLIYPREIYQRGVQRKRVELIAADFNEYVANEPKISFRNGKYYVVDGQHTIEARILRNGGRALPILCKVYTGMTMQQEALLFAEQNGHSAPLSAGIKLRAKVAGDDAPSKEFLAATNRVGLAFNYDSLQLSDYRISCVGTALKLYNEMGEKIYCESLRLIVVAWDGKPDSFRASVLRGMMHFVELYHGEFSEERLVRALGSVHPMEIYRVGRDNPAKLPGSSMMQMDVGPLFGLFLQSFFIGITMRILSIVIFVIVYGRMIEIYMMVSLAPVPMATWGNHEQSHVGQNYLKSLFALGFQGFLILICVAIYAVLLQNVAISGDAINSIWSIVGYTVLLCFTLFKTGSVARSILGAH